MKKEVFATKTIKGTLIKNGFKKANTKTITDLTNICYPSNHLVFGYENIESGEILLVVENVVTNQILKTTYNYNDIVHFVMMLDSKDALNKLKAKLISEDKGYGMEDYFFAQRFVSFVENHSLSFLTKEEIQ